MITLSLIHRIPFKKTLCESRMAIWEKGISGCEVERIEREGEIYEQKYIYEKCVMK